MKFHDALKRITDFLEQDYNPQKDYLNYEV
jgi:hypothetical protein